VQETPCTSIETPNDYDHHQPLKTTLAVRRVRFPYALPHSGLLSRLSWCESKSGQEIPETGYDTATLVEDIQGGHDVPTEKLIARFPRTLANLSAAIRELPCVLVFDNDDLRTPFRHVAVFANSRPLLLKQPVPSWLQSLL